MCARVCATGGSDFERRRYAREFKQKEDVKRLSVQITALRKQQCIIRRMMRRDRDHLAARYGWVAHPDFVMDEVRRRCRRLEDGFIRNSRTFRVPQFGQLLPLEGPIRGTRLMTRRRRMQ